MGKAVKAVGKAISKAVGHTIKVPLKTIGEITGRPLILIGDKIGGRVGQIIKQTGKLAVNVTKYLGQAAANIPKGAIQGRKQLIKQGAVNSLKGGVGVVAGVVSAWTQQYWALAAVAVYFDTLTNNGGLTYANLNALGSLEKAVLNSQHIKKHIDEIYAGVAAISNIITYYYATLGIGSMVAPVVSSYVPAWLSTAFSVAGMTYSGYSIYSTAKYIADTNERYRKLYEEYMDHYNKWLNAVASANEIFYNIITSTEMYRYFAGGDMYNSTMAGEFKYAPLTVNEPYAYILSYPKIDRDEYEEINSFVTGRLYENMAGNEMYNHSVDAQMKW
ncbi:hypothetical protein U5B43_02865 [Campylobacter sp. 9BO]|uniref:hypothetical protein n=1 Tax=Campylobacter sp. 9BO TaxID=3424759 RepID=UPI003D325C6E